MKKLLKLLAIFVVMFGFNDINVDAAASTCWNKEANDYKCGKSELQRVYSYVKGLNGNKSGLGWKKGEEVAACYLEYDNDNFKGYFFEIMPKFGMKSTLGTEEIFPSKKVNAYYHGSDKEMYAIEDRIGFMHDEYYAVVQFEKSWKNSYDNEICPTYAAFYKYHNPQNFDGVIETYFGGEIQFSNKYDGVTDLSIEGHRDTMAMGLLCLSKDKIIEEKINSYLTNIKTNLSETIRENIKEGNKVDTNTILDNILEENEKDKQNLEKEISNLINPSKEEEGTIYCEDYIETLNKSIYSTNITQDTITDIVYHSAVDVCVGNDTKVGKELNDAENYKNYKRGVASLRQTTNPDYDKHLKNYLKGMGATNEQVSCMAKYLDIAEKVSEQTTQDFNNLISSTQSEMIAARNWIEKGFTGPGIDEKDMNCEEMLGENLTKILKFAIEVLSIVGAIIAIVNAMISLIPALIAKDADALKKAQKKCVNMAIVLVLILLLPTLIIFIGRLFGYDLSCFSWLF